MVEAHDKTIEELMIQLDSTRDGLTQIEVDKRLLKYGLNVVSTEKRINPFKLFFNQFRNLLIIILLISGLVTGIIGIFERNVESIIDVVAITIVVLLNAFLGFYQEYSAEKAINALKKLSESEVTVLRDNKKNRVKSAVIVPGDIIILETGDVVAADIRVIESYELRVNESILTGESVPVRKNADILPTDTPLADRINVVYKGTIIVNGAGLGLAVNTSLATELGKIATSLTEIKSEETPIQKKLKKLSKQLTVVIFFLSLLILILGLITLGVDQWSYLLILAIGLAVAAVPEGLPTAFTLSLALGITRMAKKNALIRKLPAVEVLGSTTVICTDKTGTLTRNEQTVHLVWTTNMKYNVTGDGYYKKGGIYAKETAIDSQLTNDMALEHILEIATLANEAAIEFQGDDKPYKIFGDPTEVALLILAEKVKPLETTRANWLVEYRFPFDSDRKRMSVIAKNKTTGKYRIMVKGALDLLLDLCTYELIENKTKVLNESKREDIFKTSENYSRNYAYRILGFAYRDITDEEADRYIITEQSEPVERDLIFVGFVGMIDPPRVQSQPAVTKAHEAGIRVIMITGDHVETAKAIGQAVSIGTNSEPITGKILDRMTDEELVAIVPTTEVFARVNPSHKLRIVNALKKLDEIVTMTGDGVNDAPALKRADIGVAMGITGTDVAKEASKMILLDDDFSNIIEAISEGRTIYSNIKKFIGYLLSANTGEIFTVVFGVIIGLALFQKTIIPILTIQLLFINIVTDTFPALALGVSPADKDVMRKKPRNPNEQLLDRDMISLIFISGFLYGIASMLIYFWAMSFTYSNDEQIVSLAETMVFVSLVIFQLLHSLSINSESFIFSKESFRNTKLIGAIFLSIALLVMTIYVPFLSQTIKTVPLKAVHWGMIIVFALPILAVDELRKAVIRYLNKKRINKLLLFTPSE